MSATSASVLDLEPASPEVKRYQRDKWWTAYGTYSMSGACNEDFNPATGGRTKRP